MEFIFYILVESSREITNVISFILEKINAIKNIKENKVLGYVRRRDTRILIDSWIHQSR